MDRWDWMYLSIVTELTIAGIVSADEFDVAWNGYGL